MGPMKCVFCPDVIDSGGDPANEDDFRFSAVDSHMSLHEHFLFSCDICQRKSRTSPIYINWHMLTSHFKDVHSLKPDDFRKNAIFPVDFRRAQCRICAKKLFCVRSSQVQRHLETDHNLVLNEWRSAKKFNLGCRLCGLDNFSSFEKWEEHFVKGKLCPKMPPSQPEVPIGHHSEEFYFEDLRQQGQAQDFAFPEPIHRCNLCKKTFKSGAEYERHLASSEHAEKVRQSAGSKTTKPVVFSCAACNVISTSKVDYDIHCSGRRHQLNMGASSSAKPPAHEVEPSKALSQFYCLLCQVYTSGVDCCRQHLAGKKHLAQVALRQGKEVLSTFDFPLMTIPCFDCDLIFTSKTEYDDHVKGRQHQLKEAEAAAFSSSRSSRSSSPAEARKDGKDRSASRERSYRCDLCQVVSSGKIDFEMHLSGRKHQEKLSKETNDGKIRPRVSPVSAANFVSRALGIKKSSLASTSKTTTTTKATIPKFWRTDDPCFFCNYCQTSFLTGDEWQNHFTSDHRHELKLKNAKSSEVFCDICKIGKISKESFNGHIWSSAHKSILQELKKPEKSRPLSLYCNLCHVFSNTVESMENHYDGKMHSLIASEAPRTVKLRCPICQIRGIEIDKFRPHLQSVDHLGAAKKLRVESSKPERKGCSCDCCGESFETANDLQSHFESPAHARKLERTAMLQLTCDVCHKDNISRNDFQAHVWSTRHQNWLTKSATKAVKTKKIRCAFCKIIVLDDNKGFFLHICGKEHTENLMLFSSKNAFSGKHLVPNDNEDKFLQTGRCPICYSEFGSEAFSSHISQIHLIQLFRCRACPSKGGVLHLSQIRAHFDEDHPDVAAEDRVLDLPQLLAFHICPKCCDAGDISKGVFTDNWDTPISNAHLQQVHSGQKLECRQMKISCRICQNIFESESAYEHHGCSVFLHDKFEVDIKALDELLAQKGKVGAGAGAGVAGTSATD